jgi:signal transduction histidine kinase
MGSLAVDDGRTLSLFFQTLLIAIALGFVLYYLFYRFVEHPVADLNKQIDNILKGNAEPTATVDIDFPVFQNLVSNVNTILARLSSGDGGGGSMGGNKDLEVLNIIRLVGYAGMAISADYNILGLNHAAEHLLGLTENQLRNQPLSLIPDQALQKSLYDLMEHASRDTAVPSKNELEFGGENTEINCQAITDKGKVSHYLVTIIPMGGVG